MASDVRVTKPDGTVVVVKQTDDEVRAVIKQGNTDPRYLSAEEAVLVRRGRKRADVDRAALRKWEEAGFAAGREHDLPRVRGED